MAAPIRFLGRVCTNLTKYCTVNPYFSQTRRDYSSSFLVKGNFFLQARRDYSSSFFVKLTGEQLWKGATSVSNAGRKRGRAAAGRRMRIKDLNRGQILGVGKKNMVWPGLNAPVFKGREIIEQRELPENKEYLDRIVKIRSQMGSFRRLKLDPLERGYSGAKLAGRKIGPPDPVGEDTFEGFDTVIVEAKIVCHMTGKFGRRRRHSILVVTGNKNGAAGFALVKAPDARGAMKKAKNIAGQRLRFVELFENHTVYHDFFARFGQTKIFVKKMPKGYGLYGHKVVKSMCEMIGITDLLIKVEGSTTNIVSITKAFFLGLQKQKTHQQLADEVGLHVVEFREERDNFPRIVASPARCRTEEEIKPDEELDFNLYISGGKVPLERPKKIPFFKYLPSWERYLNKTEKYRNHPKVRVNLTAKYGRLKSFLSVWEEEKAKNEVKAAVEE